MNSFFATEGVTYLGLPIINLYLNCVSIFLDKRIIFKHLPIRKMSKDSGIVDNATSEIFLYGCMI